MQRITNGAHRCALLTDLESNRDRALSPAFLPLLLAFPQVNKASFQTRTFYVFNSDMKLKDGRPAERRRFSARSIEDIARHPAPSPTDALPTGHGRLVSPHFDALLIKLAVTKQAGHRDAEHDL